MKIYKKFGIRKPRKFVEPTLKNFYAANIKTKKETRKKITIISCF